ncbi:MAG: adenosyl-hopene transferase HpnH [Acidibrevibacterium sp.]|jgi:hopanoid biosynthesis associated radical SAM protein HpnH|uniref:adenosyl-hopene transferase HpnH n=1 Tax=Acidibrevibacterium fodinaquatile TaxID=1969806 RepID=UPI000E0D0080|nr:adenosyl-hopene transferase HpnH [Acidibrevibacterium fodinaquatile]MCA7118456.1 adenosyl-hopene transferase HpnH [Acidibrevibacterium fodinaquatile]
MPVPLNQMIRVGAYVVKQHLAGRKRYPLVLMLEPLFRCNLACSGCGKIDYPAPILNQRLSVADCLAAADECGAPVVAIAGGEPLLHKEMPEIVDGMLARGKFVYLCTNALLLEKKLDLFKPHRNFAWDVHLDGDRAMHDHAVSQEGVFERAVAAIRAAKARGFRVCINTTLFDGADPARVAAFLDDVTKVGVDGVMISPGYAYERAPDQQHFLNRQKAKELFRGIFARGKGKKWKFNQSSLFLDFLAGNQTYRCTPWGKPTRNVFGWQRPCYLLGEGYAKSFKELMETTDWDSYGTGQYEKCADCMVHSGYEATAVMDAVRHPLKVAAVALRGPRTEGPMAPEIPLDRQRPAQYVFSNHVEKAMEAIHSGKESLLDAAE